MKPEHWQRLKPIILDALELPEDAWSDFLTRACGGNQTLIQEALRLLQKPTNEHLSKQPLIHHFS